MAGLATKSNTSTEDDPLKEGVMDRFVAAFLVIISVCSVGETNQTRAQVSTRKQGARVSQPGPLSLKPCGYLRLPSIVRAFDATRSRQLRHTSTYF